MKKLILSLTFLFVLSLCRGTLRAEEGAPQVLPATLTEVYLVNPNHPEIKILWLLTKAYYAQCSLTKSEQDTPYPARVYIFTGSLSDRTGASCGCFGRTVFDAAEGKIFVYIRVDALTELDWTISHEFVHILQARDGTAFTKSKERVEYEAELVSRLVMGLLSGFKNGSGTLGLKPSLEDLKDADKAFPETGGVR